MVSTAFLFISRAETPTRPTWDSPTWDLSIRVRLITDQNPPTIPLTIRNEALASEKTRRDIRWLMEDHATRDSFDVSRADSARKTLNAFTQSLVEDISKVVSPNHLPSRGGALSIRIHHSKKPHLLHCLPWEALCDRSAWASNGLSYEDISVDRVVLGPKDVIPGSIPAPQDGKLHLLLLCARSEGPDETPADLISITIAKIVSKYPRLKERIELQMVRPGTYSALVSALRAKPKGYYQFVHIDMHGKAGVGG